MFTKISPQIARWVKIEINQQKLITFGPKHIEKIQLWGESKTRNLNKN